MIKRKTGDRAIRRFSSEELLERHFAAKLPLDHRPFPLRDSVSEELLDRLRCPLTLARLERRAGALASPEAGIVYPVASGIPDLEPSELPAEVPADRVEARYRRLFSPQNVARTPAERRGAELLLGSIERGRSFMASPDLGTKFRKLRRVLLGGESPA